MLADRQAPSSGLLTHCPFPIFPKVLSKEAASLAPCNFNISLLHKIGKIAKYIQGDMSSLALDSVDFYLGIPPYCPLGMPSLPYLQLPKQKQFEIGTFR